MALVVGSALLAGFAAGLSGRALAPLAPLVVSLVWVALTAGPGSGASGDSTLGYVLLDGLVAVVLGEGAVAIGFLLRR